MIWLYLQKAMYRPCDLDLWPMKVNIFLCIEYHPINILPKFQIDISSNSWEIKYQNIGRTHTQTDRHTHTHTHRQTDRQTDRVKTIPRNPLRGRGKNTNTTKHIYRVPVIQVTTVLCVGDAMTKRYDPWRAIKFLFPCFILIEHYPYKFIIIW